MRAGLAYPIGARKRIRGLQLVATDTDFNLGTGPVEGPIEAILPAIAGRSASPSSPARAVPAWPGASEQPGSTVGRRTANDARGGPPGAPIRHNERM